METAEHKDPDKTTIITGSEMNQRTFRDEESWASLESTILSGNCAVEYDETSSSSSSSSPGAADEIATAKDKSKLATVSEEQDCTDESREKDEFSKQDEVAEDEEDNVLNMNIDAIVDEEVFFDCPIILSPRPYFLQPANNFSRFRSVSPGSPSLRKRPFLTLRTTGVGTSTFASSTSSNFTTSTGDSGLDEERTGMMIGQIVEDFNDMGKHAQSTPKIIEEVSELGSSISSANILASEDKNEQDDNCVMERTKKRLEFPMDDESEIDTSKRRKKRITVPAETLEFVKNLDSDDNRDECDSNNNIIIVTAKKRFERPSEIVRRVMKDLSRAGGNICQKRLVQVSHTVQDRSENSVDSSEDKGRGVEENSEAANNSKKNLENSESAKEKPLAAKKSGNVSSARSIRAPRPVNEFSKDQSTSRNESEATNTKKNLENSKSAKAKPPANKSDSTSYKELPGIVSSARSIRAPRPINKFYKCPSPLDQANKENYYAGKYSHVKRLISPLPGGPRQKPTQRVAKMKEFFENRSRASPNSTSRKSLKRSPGGPTFHTTVSMKLRRSSPKVSQASQASSVSSYNPIHDASTFLLTRNQSRYLRPSSCSDYSSSLGADKLDDMSAAHKSKSMENLSSESAQAAELRRFAMSKHITKQRGAYLKVNRQRTALNPRTPKKKPSPKQLLDVNSPKKSKSDIMKRKSFGYVSSPVKPVTELRKIFSPSYMAMNANTKRRAGRTSKTLPQIIVNGN